MSLESVDLQFSVHLMSGFPTFVEAARIEEEILADAGLSSGPRFGAGRRSPTTFHVAVDERGLPLGVASSTVGPLAELPLGLALAAAGLEYHADQLVPDPACELVSVAVDAELAGEDRVTGVTEALYRSFYRRAKRSDARSAVAGVDPWIFDLLAEEYGLPFTVLGPPIEILGRELLAIGGALDVLQAGLAAARPQFAAYLDQPYELPSAPEASTIPSG